MFWTYQTNHIQTVFFRTLSRYSTHTLFAEVSQNPLKTHEHLIIRFPQVAIASALVAVTFAAGPPAYGAPPPAVYKEEKLPPQPYAYEYGVADDYSHSNFKKTETQDAGGNVAGSFTIALPDGRIQTTTYTADHTNGFVAEVSYSGEAIFPQPPLGDILARLSLAMLPLFRPTMSECLVSF